MAIHNLQSVGKPVAGSLQSVAYTATAASAAAMSARAFNIRSDQDFHMNIGAVATPSDPKLYANTDYQFKITPGDVISLIRASSNGTAEIYELD